LLDNDFNTYLRPQMQNYFIWAKQPYDGVQVVDWEYPYRAILTANIVIDGLKGIEVKKDDHEKAQNVKGQALFHRGHLYFQLAQVFAPPFIKERDNQVLSIPLRLSADINEPLQRSTVKETYELIISDLKKAIPLLDKQKIYKHRPSKQAGY